MRPRQVLQGRFKVELEVIARKESYTFPKNPELKPHHQIQFSVKSSGGRGFTHLQRGCWRILQLQPTELSTIKYI